MHDLNTITQLNTPCLLLDEVRLQNNISKMVSKAQQHNVRLRPHAKTAKSAAIMKRFYGQDTPLTVSTLKEAEYFAEHGFKDLLYAVCLSPDKLERVARLYAQGVTLTVVLDSLAVATAVAAWSERQQIPLSVAIEIDCDGHRAGLTPDSPELVKVAQALNGASHLQFWGLMTHGGGAYDCADWQAVKQHAIQEQTAILAAKDVLNDAQVACANLSLGSTPTVVAADSFAGVDEIRPGVFVFFDLFQAQLGVCQQSNIALSVLSTVTSHKPQSNRIFLDAGGLALSKDRSTQSQSLDYGYGKLLKMDGGEYSDLICVIAVNQEHGVVQLPENLTVSDFPVGSRVRILPNHACMTAAAHQGYYLLSGEHNEPKWIARCNGW